VPSRCKGQGARVIVTEIDPICALQAAMEGYQVTTPRRRLETADIFITTTGNKGIISAEHMARMKHQAIVGNIGHFDNEIDMAGLARMSDVQQDQHQAAGRRVRLPRRSLGDHAGRGPSAEPGLRHRPPELRDVNSFTNQVIAQIELFTKTAEYPIGVYTLPKHLDEKVARLHLDALGVKLTELTQEQADYIGVPVDGPYKPDHYRYCDHGGGPVDHLGGAGCPGLDRQLHLDGRSAPTHRWTPPHGHLPQVRASVVGADLDA
jgi:adenosylhomocysteinase